MKTDKKDAIRIANYGLDRWVDLVEYTPDEEIRHLLKTYNRQYDQYVKLRVSLKNNLISLIDQTFPGVNTLFVSPPKNNGHEKWVDFIAKFWHRKCVCSSSKVKFTERYNKWCRSNGYYVSDTKAAQIFDIACGQIDTLPHTESTKRLITQATEQLNAIEETIAATLHEMQRLAAMLPEYPVVMSFSGVGDVLGPQLIAEIGDVRRFSRKQSLVAFAGVDAPPYQSGTFESKNRRISKRGSPVLRKTLFLVMRSLIQHQSEDDPIYQFMDKKRSEGKHYYVYMMAGANKFLRVKAYLEQQNDVE